MTKFIFLMFCWLAFLWDVKADSKVTSDEERPNFILIVADDLGFGDLSCTGSTQISTPHIDRLAKTGVFCTQGYVSSAVCAPSRAGFLTGINQVEFGFDNNIGGNQPGFDATYMGLPIGQKTIADKLKKLGYVTGLIGKWHLGDAPLFHPLKRGFDEFWGYPGGGHDYFNAQPDGKGYLSPIECNYKTPQSITYITDDKGNECVDFIRRHKSDPFFLFASFNAPHAPLQGLEEDIKLYNHIKDSRRRVYAAMIHRLDVNVGRIIEELKAQGIQDNTVVVFFSDNGGPVDVTSALNAPYRGQKGILLEGGIHVPFIFSWPGKITGDRVYDRPVSSLDVAPTFVQLAGGDSAAVSGMDGVNIVPILLGQNNSKKDRELKWRFTISAAIREGDWKLIRLPDRLPMLYDLSTDGSEQNNVALQNLDKTTELLQKLGEWDVQLPHPVFLEGAGWKKRQLWLYDANYLLEQPDKKE